MTTMLPDMPIERPTDLPTEQHSWKDKEERILICEVYKQQMLSMTAKHVADKKLPISITHRHNEALLSPLLENLLQVVEKEVPVAEHAGLLHVWHADAYGQQHRVLTVTVTAHNISMRNSASRSARAPLSYNFGTCAQGARLSSLESSRGSSGTQGEAA